MHSVGCFEKATQVPWPILIRPRHGDNGAQRASAATSVPMVVVGHCKRRLGARRVKRGSRPAVGTSRHVTLSDRHATAHRECVPPRSYQRSRNGGQLAVEPQARPQSLRSGVPGRTEVSRRRERGYRLPRVSSRQSGTCPAPRDQRRPVPICCESRNPCRRGVGQPFWWVSYLTETK